MTLLISSCSKNGGLTPVQGKVTFNGQPAEGALVFFHPEGKTGPNIARPHAVVKADGTFDVGTNDSKDGAAPGKYGVSIRWNKKSTAGGDHDGPNLIPVRYQDPKTSGFSAEVQAKATTLPAFELKP